MDGEDMNRPAANFEDAIKPAAALSADGAGRLRAHCPDIIRELLLQEKPGAVIAHAYEGGHPDHDAAAIAVHYACRLIEAPTRNY